MVSTHTHTSKGEKGVGGFFAKIFPGKSGERSDDKKQDDLDGVCVCISTVSCCLSLIEKARVK